MHPKVGFLYPQLMPPIRVVKTVPPVAIHTHGTQGSADSSVLFDFGNNIAGYTTLSLDLSRAAAAAAAAVGSADATPTTIMLRLKHTEIVGDDGKAFNNVTEQISHAWKLPTFTPISPL
jgi:hypothetical protein